MNNWGPPVLESMLMEEASICDEGLEAHAWQWIVYKPNDLVQSSSYETCHKRYQLHNGKQNNSGGLLMCWEKYVSSIAKKQSDLPICIYSKF